MLGTAIEGMKHRHRDEVNKLKGQVKEFKEKEIFGSTKVMKSISVKVRKKHECAKCGKSIPKRNKAINTVFRYDNRLISVYFCSECKILNT